MAHGQNSEQEREAMLRRVAIVLSSLPPAVASKLIGSIAPDSKQDIRRAMTTLDDVDPLERRRAFHAFKVSIEQQHTLVSTTSSANRLQSNQPSSPNPDARPAGSRVVSGDTVQQADSALRHPAGNEPTASPMSFLEEVDDHVLLRLLVGEHPQTVALVLASISPTRAGRVLPQLDARTQTETLHRIGRLEGIPDTAIADVSEHFKQRVVQQSNQQSQSLGRSALDAILAAMPAQSRPPASTNMHTAPGNTHTAPDNTHTGPRNADPPSPSAFPSANEHQQELAHKLRVAEHTLPEEYQPTTERPSNQYDSSHQTESREQVPLPDTAPARPVDTPSLNSTSMGSTDAIAQHLESLTPTDLCQALGRVETRIAMLALCGLPAQTTNAALAVLPKSEAKRVRHAMNSIGSLNLRDIDDAKEAVARASVAAQQHAPLAA